MICEECGCEYGGEDCPECFWDQYEYEVMNSEAEEYE